MKVRLTLDPDARVVLESPYDRPFVDRLKGAIPWDGREWAPDRKRWLISALYADELVRFLQQSGAQIQDDRELGRALAPKPPLPDDLRWAFDTLYLAYNAPLGVAEAAYKFLARQWHPDMGGTPENFHAVNDAIAIIRVHLTPPTPDDDIPF